MDCSTQNLHHTRDITPMRITSGGAHLRDLAPGQHSSEVTSQRWRAVGDTESDVTNPGIETQTSRTDNDVLKAELIKRICELLRNIKQEK